MLVYNTDYTRTCQSICHRAVELGSHGHYLLKSDRTVVDLGSSIMDLVSEHVRRPKVLQAFFGNLDGKLAAGGSCTGYKHSVSLDLH
eukprot:CAMPEP_0114641906 /NCGR_PEP_ID=MMETSP0191-20121206/2526_1 /TAXON_ID=126664 /ORGANISM="Sorites sp." /LENGTH=86 /DNA_ID=CAMNT_0001854017 /DNA_START=286 /DNA_END=546 /DNA_ORIENTATION=+